jgi:hypothetical protein
LRNGGLSGRLSRMRLNGDRFIKVGEVIQVLKPITEEASEVDEIQGFTG